MIEHKAYNSSSSSTRKTYEGNRRTMISRAEMKEHWRPAPGYHDACARCATLRFEAAQDAGRRLTFDLHIDGRE